MQLKLQHLKNVVERAQKEEKTVALLRQEVRRVLGPIMTNDTRLDRLAEEINDRVAVMNRTGRTGMLSFKPSSVIPFMNHNNPEVRTMAANLVPPSYANKMKADPHAMVRAVVASRVAMETVREMMRRFPRDDELRTIYRARRKQLNEAGLPNPKVVDEPFDMYGEERLGDAVKQDEGPSLSDDWYESAALKLVHDFGNNLERNWEEIAVNNFVRHSKATSGVEIDSKKLLDKIKEIFDEHDDKVLERDALKELASDLYADAEPLNENFYTDDADPVSDLLHSNLSPSAYLEQANKLFQVRESSMPLGLKKWRNGKASLTHEQRIPSKARIPGNKMRAIDEQALDLYVKHWNDRMMVEGEPFRLEWTNHPSEEGVIGFNGLLK